jgi:hypothetical protein
VERTLSFAARVLFDSHPLGIAEERPESFLLEMAVVGQNFGDLFLARCLHGNAIDQLYPLSGRDL